MCTVHGILQARILEWVAFPFSRGSSQPRDWTQVSSIASRSFTIWATREAQEHWSGWPIPSPADLPDPGLLTGVSCIAGGFFTNRAIRKAHILNNLLQNSILAMYVFKSIFNIHFLLFSISLCLGGGRRGYRTSVQHTAATKWAFA